VRVLILGATGMLGHMLLEAAAARGLEVFGVCRRIPAGFETFFTLGDLMGTHKKTHRARSLGIEYESEESSK
jgi:nucleoside-diphosphate-sugar epimerase